MLCRPGYAAAILGMILLATPGCPERAEYEGPSIRFDGDGDHARIGVVGSGDPLALAGSTFTVAAWFLQEAGGDLYQRIVDKSDEVLGHNGWALAADAAPGQIHFYVHDGARGGDFVTRRGAYDVGRWHHVAAVARADRHEIWVDGRRDGGAFYEGGEHTLPALAETEMRIGTWNHDEGREWKGALGEVAVWRRDLRPEEIVELARNRGRRVSVAADDLVGYWRMAPDPEEPAWIRDLSDSRTDARIVRTGSREAP